MKKIIIVGGGFAGLHAAKILGNKNEVHVTLIDRCNYHLFQPLLYQVATAALSPADIAIPIRSILAKYRNVDVILGQVGSINLQEKSVDLDDFKLNYDYLILACGVSNSYFGHEDWAQYAPGLKSIDDALEIRRRILLSFEKAETECEKNNQQKLLTFVVVGGGPTGVELAGAIAEIAGQILLKDFRFIDPKQAQVILLSLIHI